MTKMTKFFYDIKNTYLIICYLSVVVRKIY